MLIKNFNNKKQNYKINFELPVITKDNTKFIINNAGKMLSTFFPQKNEENLDYEKNIKNLNKLLDKFACIIVNKYNASSYTIYNNSISVIGVKNVKKKINTDGIMSCLHYLINENFTCSNCSTFGSIYINHNLKICRNCRASVHLIKF